MYGLINKAVANMVCQAYGDETWEAIKRKAGVDVDIFLSMKQYDDAVTYQLVGAASELLDTPAEAILEGFGRFWVTFTAEKGYGALIKMSGDNLREFLYNLDHMHARVALSFPNLEPPSFHCEEIEGGDLRLYYESDRPGLTPLVKGLLFGLAERFDTTIEVEIEETTADGADCDVFRIHWIS